VTHNRLAATIEYIVPGEHLEERDRNRWRCSSTNVGRFSVVKVWPVMFDEHGLQITDYLNTFCTTEDGDR